MKKLSALFLLALLTACGPQFQTTYEIVPPASMQGRQCANNCIHMKQGCEGACYAARQDCVRDAERDAQIDYLTDALVARTNDQKLPPRPYRNHEFTCAADDCLGRCTQNYNVCHTNCGGRVIERTICVANCEELAQGLAPPPQPSPTTPVQVDWN